MPTSLAKAKARAIATPSDRITDSGERIRLGIQPTIVSQSSVPQQTFSGNFDLYGMYLPFLAQLCLPHGATTPNYSAVYDKILASQAKHDYTARCFLAPHGTSSSAPPHGRFESAMVLDHMAERPFDITLDAFTYKTLLTFTRPSGYPSKLLNTAPQAQVSLDIPDSLPLVVSRVPRACSK